MNKQRLWKICLCAITISAAVLVVCLNSPQLPNSPMLSVRFVGRTNDSAGTSQAVFELRNTGSAPFYVTIPGAIEITNEPPQNPGKWWTNSPELLRSSPPIFVNLPMPQTKNPWRAQFYCMSSGNFVQRLKNLAVKRGIPITPVLQEMLPAYSEWLKPTAEVNWVDWLQSPLVETNGTKPVGN